MIKIDLNTNAKWSNGDTINASDVVMSYKLAEKQPKFTSDLPRRFEDYITVDDDTGTFKLYPNAFFSKIVLSFISHDVPIIPWEDCFMNYTGGTLKSLDGNKIWMKLILKLNTILIYLTNLLQLFAYSPVL